MDEEDEEDEEDVDEEAVWIVERKDQVVGVGCSKKGQLEANFAGKNV